jgi:16S rRNA (cytosine967-C5)-methyltransferase
MAAPARAAALRALRLLRTERIDLGDALARTRDPLSDIRDRALATELVVGTLRWRNALDYQLQLRSSKPLVRLDADVLDALRLAAYQLLHLRSVPVSAAVNDAVALVKAAGYRSAAAFANAVLRRLVRERDALTWPARPSADTQNDRAGLVEHLSVVYSHPDWLVDRWLDRYGVAETETWLAFNNRPPALTLRANRLWGTRDEVASRLRAEGIETSPTTIAPDGLILTSGRPIGSDAHQDGAFVIQDEASQIIPLLVEASAAHRVLDACASPGGKTIALSAQTARSRLVVAADVRWRRMELLAATLRRCRADAVHMIQIAAAGELPFQPASFDRALVDAPCSGLGTIRRDPDIRWRRQPDDLPALRDAQVDLLKRIASVVAARGRLIYSTCSTEPEENEDVVMRFLATTPGFSVVNVATLSNLPPAIHAMTTREGYLRTSPRFGLEGFFAAVLART